MLQRTKFYPLFQKHRAVITSALFWVMLGILTIITFIMRVYGLRSTMEFGLDQGNQVEIIYNLVFRHMWVWQGPPTSTNHLYHGAYYYYIDAIPSLVSHGDPLVITVFTILLCSLVVLLLGLAMQQMYGRKAGLLAGLLYALSFTAYHYSRFIWNPNLVPFFMALSIFALVKLERKKPWFLPLFTFGLASVTQLHIGGLILLPVLLIMLPFLWYVTKQPLIWAVAVVTFLIPWFPTIYNEVSNGYPLWHALVIMFSTHSTVPLATRLEHGWMYLSQFFADFFQLPVGLYAVILVMSVIVLLNNIRFPKKPPFLVSLYILLTLAATYGFCSFYDNVLFTHFAEQLFVIYPILLMIALLFGVQRKVVLPLVICALIYIGIVNYNAYQTAAQMQTHEYADQLHICQILQQHHITKGRIVLDGVINPSFMQYLCDHQYDIALENTKTAPTISVTTDYRKQFNYHIDIPKTPTRH